MAPKKLLLALLCATLSLSISAKSKATSSYDEALCANSFEKTLVRDYYYRTPAQPMPIPNRDLELIETKIVSALSPKEAIGVMASPERFAEVYRSIDSWGANNNIKIVITVNGWHAFSFPSKVPVTQKDMNDGFYDFFSDEGRGLHAHINPDLVSMIYATKLPAADGSYLRTISFYGDQGDLIAGMYASEAGQPIIDEVIAGFDRSWEVIKAMPRACKKKR